MVHTTTAGAREAIIRGTFDAYRADALAALAAGPEKDHLATLILLTAMFALLWLLLIRPQRQRQLKQQHLLGSIEPRPEPLTVGGLYGIVREIDEVDLVVEIAEGIQVRIARRAIASASSSPKRTRRSTRRSTRSTRRSTRNRTSSPRRRPQRPRIVKMVLSTAKKS